MHLNTNIGDVELDSKYVKTAFKILKAIEAEGYSVGEAQEIVYDIVPALMQRTSCRFIFSADELRLMTGDNRLGDGDNGASAVS